MSGFKDHFSKQAAIYARARPTYPQALFAWLASIVPSRSLAWDAGCGNGQSAAALAAHFEQVVASDSSARQIAQAVSHPRVVYRVEAAEAPTLDDASVDLVTVAQALHWFDVPRFHRAVQRVLRAGGAIAEWSYALCGVDAAVDRVFLRLYEDMLGPYWPPERGHVEEGYRGLPFPFETIEAPTFDMRLDWTLPQYLDYLRSWSASQRFAEATGTDAVAELADAFLAAWGEPAIAREVRWPLALRVGRVR